MVIERYVTRSSASHSDFWQYNNYISRNSTGEGHRKYKQVLHESDPESRKGFQDKVLLSLQHHTGAQINFALVLPVTPDMLSCGGDDVFNSGVMVFAGDERDVDWIVRLEKAWNLESWVNTSFSHYASCVQPAHIYPRDRGHER